jgi:hypothetical protein
MKLAHYDPVKGHTVTQSVEALSYKAKGHRIGSQ